jgi:cupin domain
VRGCTIVGPGGSCSGAQGLDYAVLEAGDFVHIPAGVPHLPANTGDVDVEAVLARTDPSEQESVVTLPELDGLAHLPWLAA